MPQDYGKPADELMWMNFETKMRILIRQLVEPIIQKASKDNEEMITMRGISDDTVHRVELLE